MKPAIHKQSFYQPAQHRILPLFPTPFLRGQLGFKPDMIIRDMDRLIDMVAEKDNKDKNSNYTSYFDNDIRQMTHRLPWFNDFSNIMKDTYIEFIRTQFNKEVKHLSRNDIHLFAWINRYDAEHDHQVHNHVDSHISGTYYVNCSDRPIKFWNPNMAAQYAHNGTEDMMHFEELPNMGFMGCEGFQSEMMFEPSAGDFLLWPSYLLHSVPPTGNSKQEELRYSISFNLKYRQELNDTETGDALYYSDVFGE